MREATRTKPILTCYYPVGDDRFDAGVRSAYETAGVDIMELGIPTFNPTMDGADITASMRRTLDAGVDLVAALDEVSRWTHADAARPAGVLMAYPDLDFATLCPPAVLDRIEGMLLLGLEGREDKDALKRTARAHGVSVAGFLPADFTDADIAVARQCDGYVMLQAASGPTGPRASVDPANRGKIDRLRAEGITSPILLGFGISNGQQARESVDLGADGVVIGSICVRAGLQGQQALADLLGDVRSKLDA